MNIDQFPEKWYPILHLQLSTDFYTLYKTKLIDKTNFANLWEE